MNEVIETLRGRLLASRHMGRSWFGHVLADGRRLQVYSRASDEGGAFACLRDAVLGSHVQVTGHWFVTRSGETTLHVHSASVLNTPRIALTGEHYTPNLQTQREHRELDLMVNPASRRRFEQRCRIIQQLRQLLWQRNFIEVQTPVLQRVASGASATPFTTHCRALNVDLSLRIATEFHLERLVVGGYDRVFEIGPVFRNEGISSTHHPEFTSLEVYQAFASLEDMVALVSVLIQRCAAIADLSMQLPFNGHVIDFTRFNRISFEELVHQRRPDLTDLRAMHDYYTEHIEHTLIQPTFVFDLPAFLCPLARAAENENYVNVFELVIGGMEVAPAYQQQNDPAALEAAMRASGLMVNDPQFIHALNYGMPPTAGLGVGIDRLVQLLTDTPQIADVITFPL